MKTPPNLLAKTPSSPVLYPETLVGHTERVLEATRAILDSLKESGLTSGRDIEWTTYEKLVYLSAILHDLGKATNVFQGMLLSDHSFLGKVHPVRHEILSALLIMQLQSPLRNWLVEMFSSKEDVFGWMVSWVAGGHHLKLHQDQVVTKKDSDRLVRVQGIPKEFIFLGSHPDMQDVLGLVPPILGFGNHPPRLEDISIPVLEDDDPDSIGLQTAVDEYIYFSETKARELTEDDRITLALAKAVLVAADVTASALTRKDDPPTSWLKETLWACLSPLDLERVIEDRLQGSELHPFQVKVANSKNNVTVTIAGCGNGKTLAAYAWASNNARGKKLFFCYPTTGTASEGFKDYLLAQTEMERALIHSRAQVDMETILGTPELSIVEESQTLDSLKVYSQQVIACTADTVLGLIQNQRRGLFSFPAIAKRAFVFDEIHNYDSKLFGALLTFLKAFPHTPFLIMSASIPRERIEYLREALGTRMGDLITGEASMEELKRYRLEWKDDGSACWTRVADTLCEGKKALWVCNTVGDAVRIYRDASRKNLSVYPIVYHSRFRYKDRVERQRSVINAFNRDVGPTLIISTQVCEMSLNISSDLMVSALAPLPSLIQRLGRLNRHVRADCNKDSTIGSCLVHNFGCADGKPYWVKDLQASLALLKYLWGKPCSQRDLAEVLGSYQLNEEIKTYSAWLDGTWQTTQRRLREGDDSITVLLERDLEEIGKYLKKKGQKPNSHNIAAWTVPLLYDPHIRLAGRLGCYPVIGDSLVEYDEETGARWRKAS